MVVPITRNLAVTGGVCVNGMLVVAIFFLPFATCMGYRLLSAGVLPVWAPATLPYVVYGSLLFRSGWLCWQSGTLPTFGVREL